MKPLLSARPYGLCILLVLLFALSLKLTASSLCPATGKMCVLTWQQDTSPTETCTGCVYRTGENLNENIVTFSNIITNNFQQLCSLNLDGQVYAQPLVVVGATVNGVTPANASSTW